MNSFVENVNYVANLDNKYGSGIELYKNNLSLKSVQHDIELKFSYYSNYDKKIHSIVHLEPGVLVGGIDDTLLSFKTLVESSITGSEFTCTVSSGVQNFVINNVVMVNINIVSNSNIYKTYELEMKVVTAGDVTYNVFGEVKDSLKILPSLATITASDIDAIANVYEIQEYIITVSENIANVETVSDSIANVNITGTNIMNVNIVGEDINNVNTVSTHISNVDTVSQSITNVDTVSSNIVDVGIASTNIASINTVANAQNLADIIRVADDLNSLDVNGIADITIVANDLVLGVDSNIITVSESIDNVNITGNDIDNINIVGTDIANIDIVSTNINDINITANNIASINTVSSNIADVNTVSDGIINVNTVSGSIANVNTVASNIVGLNSIVSNMTEILLADDNAAIATIKALESSDSAAASLQSSLDSAASAALFPNHIADTTNPHEVTKIQVGLEFVDNTADADKVVASAGKLTSAVNISLSGDASGSVSFDGSGDADIVVSIENDSHIHSDATTSVSGFMSTSDKIKLDAIAPGSNNYVHPLTHDASIITTTDEFSNSDSTNVQDVLDDLDYAIDVEKGRIDAILIGSGANADTFAEVVTLVNSIDTANDQAFAGYVLSNDARSATIEGNVTNLTSSKADKATTYTKSETDAKIIELAPAIDISGKADKATTLAGYGIADAYTKTEINSSLALKVDKVAGKGLSTADYTSIEKSKLNDIAYNANNYSLPIASASVLGGVKAGANITIDAAGVISASASGGADARIEKINANPDSTSGIVTVPKVIASGETITIPAGRVAILPNVQIDGVLNVEGEVFIPSGATLGDLDAQLALKADTSYVNAQLVLKQNILVANDAGVKTALNATGTAPIYACRAWVNFNGTGTVAIRASGNVSSITDNGVGDYTVNFTTAMTDGNYSPSITTKYNTLGTNNTVFGNISNTTGSIAASSLRVRVQASQAENIFADIDTTSVSIFR